MCTVVFIRESIIAKTIAFHESCMKNCANYNYRKLNEKRGNIWYRGAPRVSLNVGEKDDQYQAGLLARG